MTLANQHALIIGGSITGLATARVLADHFERVTIVERDMFPSGPEFRPGTPQAHHIHILLMQGQYLLERLFPGLQDDLAAAGAPAMDWINDVLWFGYNRFAPRFPSGLVGRVATRSLLEYAVRQRLAANPRVEFLTGREAIAPLVDATRTRVTGIRVRSRADLNQVEEIPADLVVDASGRESKMPLWLESLGYARPQETVVNSFLGYSSRLYQVPDKPRDWQGILVRGIPPESRGAGIVPVEGNRWMVNLGAARRDYPPTDEAGWMEFIRTLPEPTIYNALRDAQPLSPIYGYRRTENRLRHYERVSRLPENMVALGDAVCAFNPVYGQGMTVGIQGALALGECVRTQGGLIGLPGRFYRRLAKVTAITWSMATSVDFLYPETEGVRPGLIGRLANSYSSRVAELAVRDPEVHRAFFKVIHLVNPPGTLFTPRIAYKVLTHGNPSPVSSRTEFAAERNPRGAGTA